MLTNVADSYDYRIVRFKTEEELLNTGWTYNELNDTYILNEDSHFIASFMKLFLGKILVIKRPLYYESDGWIFHMCESVSQAELNGVVYTITEEMIAEDLIKENYPEYFV